ncbi:hypothetical protein LZZ90_00755 [Flavobacterium sp. SM15]|uniref:hypothetical protein n=1 Tax=Flavobacterium sp. SM15 TaxID=2908005 RepID=UPI001EDB39D1|nr:hypothetical protein [Flavobacterium sp. SM15]MCG2610032.1 hypothetical protein [Flavobacterium sp. SM15]
MGALIVVIIGLIGVLLGYIIGKSSSTSYLEKELDKFRQKAAHLQTELNAIHAKSESGSHILGFSSGPAVHANFNPDLASSVIGKKVTENDLTVIEGINPKVDQLLTTSGILSWKALSETSVDRCNEILSKAGERFTKYNPSTWPRQARLAYEGKWRDLKAWQDSLVGGVE